MASDPELSRHVRHALLSGQPAGELRKDLGEAGWTAPEIDEALSGWMLHEGGRPVPRPVRSSAARDALFYALLFVVFGMVAGNTLALLFGQADLRIPAPGDTRQYARLTGLRWPMAAVIVFLPVFWFLHRADRRAACADPSRRHGPMRRWLAAIAMLAAVIALLGDALYVIHAWLDGQITLRFAVKAGIVAGMALIVLAYFRENRAGPVRGGALPAGWGLMGMAVVSLGLSLQTVGGPAQGQMEQRDRWRLDDLQMLARDVAACDGIDGSGLPETLDPMTCARNPALLTGFASEVRYERTGPARFRLCIDVEVPAAATAWGLSVSGNTVCTERETD